MNLLNKRDLQYGAEGFVVLVGLLVPLLICYRLSGERPWLALPLTAAFDLAFVALWRRAWAGADARRQVRIEQGLRLDAERLRNDPFVR